MRLLVSIPKARYSSRHSWQSIEGIESVGIPEANPDTPIKTIHFPEPFSEKNYEKQCKKLQNCPGLAHLIYHPMINDRNCEAFSSILEQNYLHTRLSFEVMDNDKNESYPDNKILGSAVKRLKKKDSTSGIGICLDTCHILPSQELFHFWDSYLDVITHIHISDYYPSGNHYIKHLPPTAGKFPWESFFRWMKDRYHGYYVLELHGHNFKDLSVCRTVQNYIDLVCTIYNRC